MSRLSGAVEQLDGVAPSDVRLGTRATAKDEPLAEFVPILLSVAKATRALTGLMLAEIDLNAGQDQLLAALDAEHPVSVSKVSSAINVRPSTTSKMVDRLVAKGLVERCDVDSDARLTLLRLTPVGETKRAEVHDLWTRLESGLAGRLDATDDGGIVDALHVVEAALRSRLSRLR